MKKIIIKKLSFGLFVCFLIFLRHDVLAVPAYPYPIKVTQPDGTTLTIRLNGDEWFNYTTTEDGYMIVKDKKNFYVYATVSKAGKLAPTNRIARNANARNVADASFLKSLDMNGEISRLRNARSAVSLRSGSGSSVQLRRTPTTGNPNFLVLLIEFSDREFNDRSTAQTRFSALLNEKGYSANGSTGSAKDFFEASSYGKFQPNFDVMPPVKLSNTAQYYLSKQDIEKESIAGDFETDMIIEACRLLDISVDFAKYDKDEDGKVDNVLCIVAGWDRARGTEDGIKSNLWSNVWSHRWSIYPVAEYIDANYTWTIESTIFDDVRVFDYFVTSELKDDSPKSTTMINIGTFVHEFGHILGLPDYYHTDTDKNNPIPTLVDWSIMDHGTYNNDSRTPPALSAYDRFFLGWLTPEELTSPGYKTLYPLGKTLSENNTKGQAYLVAANAHNLNGADPNPNEFFILEYREKIGWDKYIGNNSPDGPGGMLIWHIDYNATAWQNNTVNNYSGITPQTLSDHMRVYIEPSNSSSSYSAGTFTSGNFYPKLWDGTDTHRRLTDISIDGFGGEIMAFYLTYSWKLSETMTATLDAEGLLSVFSTASEGEAMPEYNVTDDIPWFDVRSDIRSVVIGDNVTSIGYGTFQSLDNLVSITIPNSVTTIGDYAFSNCTALTDITVTWENPIVVPENTFSNVNISNVTLHVPSGTKKAYQEAAVWKDFNIDDGTTTELSLTTTQLDFTAFGGKKTFDITSNTDWTVSSDVAWLTVEPSSGTDNETITVTAPANTGNSPLTATITVSGTDVAEQKINVTQEAAPITTGTVSHLEYWIDDLSDYPDTKSINGSGMFKFQLSTIDGLRLLAGMHQLHLRLVDDAGRYSAVSSHWFLKINHADESGTNALEYWFDDDFAGKREIAGGSGSTYSITQLETKGLPFGFHRLYFRAKITKGVYTAVSQAYIFKIGESEGANVLEYWFDDDFAQVQTHALASGNAFVPLDVSAAGLSQGVHRITFRTGSTNGMYSATSTHYFLKSDSRFLPEDGEQRIAEYVYWFDDDYGNATTTSITPEKTFALNTDMAIPNTLTLGQHTFNVKFMDNYGQWSETASGAFENKISVTGVSLDKTAVTMEIGDTEQLTATVTPSDATDQNVTWSTGDASIADVSPTGLITAKAAGTATITVTTADGGKTATCTVTVNPKIIYVTGVSLDKTALTMEIGDTEQLTATITPSDATDHNVTWSTGDASIADVSPTGLITAKAAGTAIITVTTDDGGKTATCTVTVNPKIIYVTGVSLDKTALTMEIDDREQLIATVTPSDATDHNVTWSTGDASVVTVSTTGLITAKAAGTAIITVTTDDGGKTATCTVTVNAVLSSDATLAAIAVSSGTLTPAFSPNITEYTVEVANSVNSITLTATASHAAATVSGDGTKSLSVGSNVFYITVKAENGSLRTYTVTVNRGKSSPVTVAVTGVSLNKYAVSMKIGDSEQLTATVTPDNATDKKVKWSSSNSSIATVSSTGLIAAKKAGTVIVAVITDDGDFMAQCWVSIQNSQTVVVGEGEPAGSNGTGAIEVSLEIPSDVPFTGTFRLTLPAGMSVDVYATGLVDELKGNLSLTVTQESNNTWLFTITSKLLRSGTELTYQKIVNIVYKVNTSVSDGTYRAVIRDVNLDFEDGTSIEESEIPVSIRVDHSYVGISDISAQTEAYIFGNTLYVNSPVAEIVQVYSTRGVLLYNLQKEPGKAKCTVNQLKGAVLIVQGSSGWVKKVIVNK
ncbi:MAG: Ig-like domain-containing protein [Tannerella sp.]|jgi:M6 family metalloprotease-like protein|nr:Ig-like domain-containing protein [Tannerella sp.]